MAGGKPGGGIGNPGGGTPGRGGIPGREGTPPAPGRGGTNGGIFGAGVYAEGGIPGGIIGGGLIMSGLGPGPPAVIGGIKPGGAGPGGTGPIPNGGRIIGLDWDCDVQVVSCKKEDWFPLIKFISLQLITSFHSDLTMHRWRRSWSARPARRGGP